MSSPKCPHPSPLFKAAEGRHTNPSSSLFSSTWKTHICDNWSHATYSLKLKIPSHFICHQVREWAVGPVPWLAICNFYPRNFILISLFSALCHVFLSWNTCEICIVSVEGNKWFWFDMTPLEAEAYGTRQTVVPSTDCVVRGCSFSCTGLASGQVELQLYKWGAAGWGE
jgi:hypothetical protein